MWWSIAAMVLGAVFGVWSHRTSGSGGWSDAFVREESERKGAA